MHHEYSWLVLIGDLLSDFHFIYKTSLYSAKEQNFDWLVLVRDAFVMVLFALYSNALSINIVDIPFFGVF
jgi:hypothetical protein